MADQLAELAADAQVYKPRLFTIYGRYKDTDDPEFIGWGMDFRDLGKTLYYEPDASETHRADNPEQILRFYTRIAEVRLEWLDAG